MPVAALRKRRGRALPGAVAALLLGAGAAAAASRPYESVGWRLTAIPIVNFSSDDGAGYGARANLYAYDGHTVPYVRAWTLQAFFTTRGTWTHRLQLDLPTFGPRCRVEVDAVYERDEHANYYGALSSHAVDALLGPADEDTRTRRTTFRHTYPSLQATAVQHLRLPWRVRGGLRVQHDGVEPNAPDGSLLELLAPLGTDGGLLVQASLALQYDSRDDYTSSTRGRFEEASVEYDIGAGGDYDGMRLALEHRHFLPVGNALVLAHRVRADLTLGDVPFYALPELGGSETLRGQLAARLRGQGRLLASAEGRWLGVALSQRQHAYLGGLLFVDAGQVFTRSAGPSLDGWHAGLGAGLRLQWQSTTVRADTGFAEGRTGIYVTFGQVF